MSTIVSSTVIDTPRAAVFAFLADAGNHWRLADGKIELVELADDAEAPLAGIVRLRGPLGVRRQARTRVVRLEEPAVIAGVAQLGGRTKGEVQWDLKEVDRGRTEVVLSARVCRAGWVDRLLLALGGRLWLRRMFASTLRRLARQLAAEEALAGLPAA
jgi:carbon monoxide dehydrogenase subunit G